MSTRRHLVLGLALAAAAAGTHASGPTFWTTATAADFLRGTSDGVSVSAAGVLTPGPALASRLTATPPQIWSLAETADGTLWAGTGGDGRLLRLRPGRPDETVLDTDESSVFAVAASGARVYAASSPDGRVYVVDGTAAPRPFFDPAEKYIWALTVDAAGRLWVGAGDPATIYRVEPNGDGQVVYRPAAAHVVHLSRDRDGRILAGTEAPGRLYRLGADDRPFAVLDSGMAEVRGVTTTADGTIYAAGSGPVAAAPADAGTAPAAVLAIETPPATGASAPPARQSKLFRIDPDGSWEAVWDTDDAIHDLATAPDGAVLVATGPAGRLYRVQNREAALLTGVDAKHITRFAVRPATAPALPSFATANPGRVLAPGAAAGAPAAFTSAVRDSRSVATWGLIRWQAAGAVRLFARSGNTETPDDSWSAWSGPYTAGQGQAITSPPARFIQWRAELSRDAASALTSVVVAYLPRNARPVVSGVTVHPPGVVFQRPFSSEEGAIAGLDDVTASARRPPGDAPPPSPSPGRRMFQKGLQTIAWKAEDADGDRLSYSLQFRREGETAWRDLRTGLLDPLYVWDTTSVVDGRYLIRVVASDEATNARERALDGEREGGPIDVDNSPPQITVAVTRPPAGARLAVRVRDGHSPIQKLEYSVSGGAWQVVYPTDGLADSPDEAYEIVLAPGIDPAGVVVRATDQLQNVATSPAVR